MFWDLIKYKNIFSPYGLFCHSSCVPVTVAGAMKAAYTAMSLNMLWQKTVLF